MPSTLTEVEIFSCMAENLRLAAEHADDLAVKPFKGPVYEKFRDEIALVEGCCNQAGTHREDARWLRWGPLMGAVHQQAGDWLRGYKDKETGERIRLAESDTNLVFLKLAEHLRAMHAQIEKLRDEATGRVGMILPKPVMPFMRDPSEKKHRVMLPAMSPGGILIPAGVGLH